MGKQSDKNTRTGLIVSSYWMICGQHTHNSEQVKACGKFRSVSYPHRTGQGNPSEDLPTGTVSNPWKIGPDLTELILLSP